VGPDPSRPEAGAQGGARGQRSAERRYRWARAYRDGELVCARVDLTITADVRLGLAPRVRRSVRARFVERVRPALRAELAEMLRPGGPAARRAAEGVGPIELVFDDPRIGRQRIVARIEPPRLRGGTLREAEFRLRETAR
jgi:hypothetical protein